MSYHSTLYTNKELRRAFSEDMLPRLVLLEIKGKPAKARGVVWKGNYVTVFGQDFVAKLYYKGIPNEK